MIGNLLFIINNNVYHIYIILTISLMKVSFTRDIAPGMHYNSTVLPPGARARCTAGPGPMLVRNWPSSEVPLNRQLHT
jgi:hypothetical protein